MSTSHLQGNFVCSSRKTNTHTSSVRRNQTEVENTELDCEVCFRRIIEQFRTALDHLDYYRGQATATACNSLWSWIVFSVGK